VEKLRKQWQRKFRRQDPQQLVFLDETGINLTLTRRYGRALRGKRVYGSVPQNYGQNVTVLGGLDRRGVRAAMAVAGPIDGTVFLTFLQQVLCPRLKLGDTVVMDNLRVHKVAGVKELIQAKGAKVCYLPPYSPDLNPIELCWSKLKAKLRLANARTPARLLRALKRSLQTITTGDAQAWFRHCGYHLH
jgi:transposase